MLINGIELKIETKSHTNGHLLFDKEARYEDKSIFSEKAFDKIQHPFMIKVLEKLGMQGKYLNITKAIFNKSIVKPGKKQGYLLSPYLVRIIE